MFQIINKIKPIGRALNHKFGTSSYEIRCKLHDIRIELEEEFKKLITENVLIPKDKFCAYTGNNPSNKCQSARGVCLNCKYGIIEKLKNESEK
jgi:hypothetical protein